MRAEVGAGCTGSSDERWGFPWVEPERKVAGMERVTGIGGYFMRARDPEALSAWYQDMLGIDTTDGVWRQAAGPTVVAAFEDETDYFGSRPDGVDRQQTMLNFRVDDLDAMLEQLQAAEADVVDEIQEMEGIGRFGWVTDPEGNRIELWEPAPGAEFPQSSEKL